MTTQKHGISALRLQRVLNIGSYQTAWTMLHRYRKAMVQPRRFRLSGHVEVDAAFIWGDRSAEKCKGKPPGQTTEVWGGVAVEITRGQPRMGCIRLAHIEDRKASSVIPFVREKVAPMSTVHTDGWKPYKWLPERLYPHVSMTLKNSPWYATDIRSALHRVASLLQRWLLGTHQGRVWDQLQGHLDEFVFQFNRRSSKHRGHLFYRLFQYAVQPAPATYEEITGSP